MGKSSFTQNVDKLQFRLKLERSGGVPGERMEHTKLFSLTLALGFGLKWHWKVHLSEFDSKLELQCIRNGPQNLFLSRVSPG